MAFRGTDFCCVDCKKQADMDVSSVGTIMFVTSEEKEAIDKVRSIPGAVLTNQMKTKKKSRA